MKLAEALAARVRLRKELSALQLAINNNLTHFEDESPEVDAASLLQEYNAVSDKIRQYTILINNTNNLPDTVWMTMSIMEAIALRDELTTKIAAYTTWRSGSTKQRYRSTKEDLRVVSVLDLGALDETLKSLKKNHAELDLAIQEANWTVELLNQ